MEIANILTFEEKTLTKDGVFECCELSRKQKDVLVTYYIDNTRMKFVGEKYLGSLLSEIELCYGWARILVWLFLMMFLLGGEEYLYW